VKKQSQHLLFVCDPLLIFSVALFILDEIDALILPMYLELQRILRKIVGVIPMYRDFFKTLFYEKGYMLSVSGTPESSAVLSLTQSRDSRSRRMCTDQ
jgi:hypothetical protein